MNIDDKLHFEPKTANSIIKKVGEIEKFQGKWETLKLNDGSFLKELKLIATIQSIGSSTRIEGSQLSDADVKELIQNLDINKLETRDEQEVIGYWETLELLLDNANEIELNERYVFQLHGLLLRYSDKDTRNRGSYKNLTNKVVARYPDGTEKTIFNTTSPHLVEKEMSELISWTQSNLSNQSINPLIVIGAFIYEFLSIHPFHDGNGRLSRLLTTLLLVKEEYYFVQYVSFEHVIEQRKKEYYQALMECQKNRYTPKENLGVWMEFFLDCIIELSAKLEVKLDRIAKNDVYLNNRQKQIFELLKVNGKMRTSNVAEEIPDVSLPTIKKDLQYMVAEEVIQKNGAGKATTYSLIDDL